MALGRGVIAGSANGSGRRMLELCRRKAGEAPEPLAGRLGEILASAERGSAMPPRGRLQRQSWIRRRGRDRVNETAPPVLGL